MKLRVLIFHLLLLASLSAVAQLPSQVPLQSFSNAGGATGTMTSGIPTHFSSIGQPMVLARPAAAINGGGVMTANEFMLTSVVVAPSPTAQPTALVFSNITTTSLTVSFTVATGSPAGYIVLRKPISAPVSNPVLSTSYTAGTTLGDATVVFVAAATTFNDTGLTIGTTYFYEAFSYNGTGSTTNYLLTSPLIGSQATLGPPPTISNFNPTSGGVGATVTITGTNFDATTPSNNTVKFGSNPAVVTASTATTLTVTVPSGASTGTISVIVATQSATSSASFTVIPPPTITSFSPTSGVVGATITIAGTNFDLTPANNTVKFNGTTAVVTGSTATSITTTVPVGATTGTITVTVALQTGTSSTGFAVISPPTITSFNPTSGGVSTSVIITGTNFDLTPANNTVKFNGTSAVVTASTTTTVTTSVPIGATSGALTVTLSGLTATSSTNFTVVPPPTITGFNPTAGVIGTPVTISGTNFDAIAVNNIVKFSGTTAVVSSSTTTSISTSVPVGAVNGATGPITVTVGGQTATSATGFTVTTIPAPTITSFNPTSGAIGATVVITGTNFDAVFSNNTVKFNGTTATPTASTTTSITTKVPTGATSGTISVTANGQTVTSTASFTVTTDTTPPTFGTNSTAGSVALGAALAINADFLDAESGVPEGTILYRSVSSTTTTYTEGALTKGTGNAFTGSVPATVIGELGLEYKLKAKNGVGLEAISQVYTVTVVHSSGLTVPINTTFAKSQSSYRIIAVPLVLTTNSISSIFGGALGGYDETVWRMYHYENATMSKLSSSSPMEQGKGYWFLSTKAPTGNFNTGVGSTVSASFDQPFEIPVNPGWNQIGNPYNFNISWTDIRNANPALASKLSATARSYNGSVIEVDKIGKFEGVYVSFTGSTSDKIKIPVAKNPNINGRIASTPLNSLDNQDWTVKFNLSNGLQQYALGGVGMHPQASEGMDPHDDFNIPRFFDYLEVKHPKNFFDMTFTLDVVPTLDQYVWNFTTETNQKSGAITMNWDNSYFGKGSQQLWLMDVETGAVWDMKKETSVTVDYSPVRRWRVAFGSDSFVKDATLPENSTLMAIFPNPFRSEISFEYVVVEPTSVKLEIMDLNGKNVGALVNQNMEKGRYVSKWVANSNGADEPAIGIYIVRFQAGSVVQYKRIMKN